MRARSLLGALGAGALLATVPVLPASAGTGPSTACRDGGGYLERELLSSPVTVGVEVTYPPGGNHQTLQICYSTTASGQPGGILGGVVVVDVYTTTNTVYPGAYVAIICLSDPGVGVGPVPCSIVNSADLALTDASVTTPPSSTCLVSVGSGCVAYAPGVKVATGRDPGRALVQLRVLGTPVDVNPPAQCIAVVVTCP